MKTASQLAPSLLTASPASADGTPEMRILASLEGEAGGAARKTTGTSTRRKSLYACLAIALIIALAYMVLRNTTASRSVAAPTTVASSAPDLPPAPANRTLATEAQDPAPAAIVDTKEAFTQHAPAPNVAPSSKPAPPPMQIFEATTTDTTPPDPVPVTPKKATSSAHTRPAPVPKREVSSPAPGVSVKNSPSPATPYVKPRDTDVDLLTALMVHTRQGTTASPTPSQSPIAPTTQGDNTVSGLTTPVRHVVVRTPIASTADLVKQCAELGWLEGWLCKRRICDNLWGKDPACSNTNATTSTQ